MPYLFGFDLEIAGGGVTSIQAVERAQLERYTRHSRELGLPPRCPIANVYRCPRFFLSLAALSNTRGIVGMSQEDIERAEHFWKNKTTIVHIAEEQPGVILVGAPEEFVMADSFCPEVLFRFVGVFAGFVAFWTRGEMERDRMRGIEPDIVGWHKALRAEGAEPGDWRWVFRDVAEKHYTQCEEWPAWGRSRSRAAQHEPRLGRRTGISPAVRWQVLVRDDYRCQYCGRRPPDVSLELDHRLPLAKGGTDDPANLVTSCQDCNRGKRDKVVGLPTTPTQ